MTARRNIKRNTARHRIEQSVSMTLSTAVSTPCLQASLALALPPRLHDMQNRPASRCAAISLRARLVWMALRPGAASLPAGDLEHILAAQFSQIHGLIGVTTGSPYRGAREAAAKSAYRIFPTFPQAAV